MGDESMDTSNGSRGDEMCRLSGGLDEEHVAISQLLELPHHGEDTAAAVPPDPPDLSPGLTHKVSQPSLHNWKTSFIFCTSIQLFIISAIKDDC